MEKPTQKKKIEQKSRKKNYNKTTIKAQIKCQKKKKAQYKINLILDYAFGYQLKNQLILLFNLFLLIFMGPTVLFDIIYRSHCTILVNFYFYLQYFQKKVFNFNKISGSQTDLKTITTPTPTRLRF